MKKPKNFYVDNKKFLEDIIEYNKACEKAEKENKPKPRIPESIGSVILKIAQNFAIKPSFSGYSFKEEMISDAVENCILYFHNYDTKRINPFAYFTQIVYYAFIRRIEKEEKQRYALYKNFQHSIIHGGENHDLMSVFKDFGEDSESGNYHIINDFMKRFEKKEKEKKKKRATKAKSKMKEIQNGK